MRALPGGNPLYLVELLREANRHDPQRTGHRRPRAAAARDPGRRPHGRLPDRAAALARAIATLARDADPPGSCAGGAGPDRRLGGGGQAGAERVLDQQRYAFTHAVVAATARDFRHSSSSRATSLIPEQMATAERRDRVNLEDAYRLTRAAAEARGAVRPGCGTRLRNRGVLAGFKRGRRSIRRGRPGGSSRPVPDTAAQGR
jgi:hypothetical protein